MKAWGQPTKGRSNSSSVASTRESSTSELDSLLAEEVARRTRELLDSQGWCLWKCNVLGDNIIAVVLDENILAVPEGYPVYTVTELEELCREDVSEASLRLVHEAKKIVGAVVMGVGESGAI